MKADQGGWMRILSKFPKTWLAPQASQHWRCKSERETVDMPILLAAAQEHQVYYWVQKKLYFYLAFVFCKWKKGKGPCYTLINCDVIKWLYLSARLYIVTIKTILNVNYVLWSLPVSYFSFLWTQPNNLLKWAIQLKLLQWIIIILGHKCPRLCHSADWL